MAWRGMCVSFQAPHIRNLTPYSQSVKEYEMVLANGTIVNISYDKHPELVVAMRGSGDQFGSYWL
jgi:hypothetical protein